MSKARQATPFHINNRTLAGIASVSFYITLTIDVVLLVYMADGMSSAALTAILPVILLINTGCLAVLTYFVVRLFSVVSVDMGLS